MSKHENKRAEAVESPARDRDPYEGMSLPEVPERSKELASETQSPFAESLREETGALRGLNTVPAV